MINLTAVVQEKFLFLYKFLRSPKQIGSVTPSSKFLARKMVDSVVWNHVDNIAELGAGTGSITKYIHEAKQIRTHVLLFEKDPFLRRELGKVYSDFSCYADACQLQIAMRNEGIEQLDCILSGLPFSNFSQDKRNKIMEQVLLSLKPGGFFIAFQYSQQMKRQLSRNFDIEEVKFVLLNFPPAFVYVCRKKSFR
jgi:phospholipid N-methyltransferase